MGFITLVAFLMVLKRSISGPWKKLSRCLSGSYLAGLTLMLLYSLTEFPDVVWNVGVYICLATAIVIVVWLILEYFEVINKN